MRPLPEDWDAGDHLPTHADDLNSLLNKYAGEIDKMYDRRTRGDYSSLGILAAFMQELEALEN